MTSKNGKRTIKLSSTLAAMALLAACGESGQTTGGNAEDRAAGSGESQAEAAAVAGACPLAGGAEFGLDNIEAALAWWIALTRELGEAQGSGNQLRIDEARKQFDERLACLIGQRISYTFSVQSHPIRDYPPIGAAGVTIGAGRGNDAGAIRVGAERDRDGRENVESTPILLRAGQEIDAGVLSGLTTKSTFDVSARIVKTNLLGQTFMRPPTLVLFVSDVEVEKINP